MKKAGILLGLILLSSIIWVLFLKPYDYLAAFNINTQTGTINQSVKTWGGTLENAKVIEQNGLGNLKQQITFNDSVFLYTWKIRPLSDSSSRVKVYIKNLNSSFKSKIAQLFGETDFKRRSKNTVLAFNAKLSLHLKDFKIKIIGQEAFKARYCAYVPLKSTQLQKAKGMMQNYSMISAFLFDSNVTLNGQPFLEISKWDIETDSIEFNFCYPIIKTDSLRPHQLIKYKQIEQQEAIKAIYNGNYITSDRAWYALMTYAEKNQLNLIKKPIEVFYNNPNMGGDELNWQAEIFMPIQK